MSQGNETSRAAKEAVARPVQVANLKRILEYCSVEPDSSSEIAKALEMHYSACSAYTALLLQNGLLARGAKRQNTDTGKMAWRLYTTDKGHKAIDGLIVMPTEYRKQAIGKEALAVAEAALEAWQHGLALPEPLNGLVALYAAKKGVGVDS